MQLLAKKPPLTIGVLIFSAAMVVLAVAGGFLEYSPVPYWDMWDATLNFFMNANDGNRSAWWAQHNEHRILLSRLLFWLDLKYFGGLSWFLITVNYLLICISVFVFWKILRDKIGTKKADLNEILLGALLTAWLFQWIQSENLTWAFQSQIILAQLLPLCALYILYKSIASTYTKRYFVFACILGVASAGTMANGVIALPLMTLYALLTRQGFTRVGILLGLSVFTLFSYFYSYHAPAIHGSLVNGLLENPLGIIEYMLLYVGSPFYYLTGKGAFGRLSATIASLVLIAISARIAIKSIRQPKDSALNLMLLGYILYIGGTAFGTAGGRLIFGLDQALSSRYTTPALMAWSAFFILYAPAISSAFKSKNKKLLYPMGILALAMIAVQFKALRPKEELLYEREMAALALTLGIKDQNQVGHVFPSVNTVLPIAEKASIRNLSIFGIYPFQGVKEELGTMRQHLTLPACKGSIDSIDPIEGDARFVRASGWIFNPATKSYPKVIRFIDRTGKVVGHALSGQPRPDVATSIDRKALLSGYRGYILSDAVASTIILQGENSFCELQAPVPAQIFSIASKLAPTDTVSVSTANILSGHQWTGSDYQKSSFNGLQVYGTYINSDENIGSIAIQIKRGDRIFYRSGPTGGRQIIEVQDSEFPPATLPIAPEWVLLDFSSTFLPTGNFIIRLSDSGTEWGEWSAIAVQDCGN